MPAPRFVSYLRVSTSRQGSSGLGLEAQRKRVESHVEQTSGSLVAEYVEVESGRRKDRRQLTEAIKQAQREKATLLVAKLDRLARSVAFISALKESGVRFQALDLPSFAGDGGPVGGLLLHVLASVGQFEAEIISQRTKDALAAAKARGVKLGKPENLIAGRSSPAKRWNTQQRKSAANYAEDIREHVERAVSEGAIGVRAITRWLNDNGVTTSRGGQWHPTTVSRILNRIQFRTAVGT
ncbi:MAG: recombinase family protein [Planctomycetota bacterium]|jgi:DNA invertase Pin-like site-specific DNA recombinase|nr:recombinase family protein [Planctomycetota bacterium]